jgi:hypothetical protein
MNKMGKEGVRRRSDEHRRDGIVVTRHMKSVPVYPYVPYVIQFRFINLFKLIPDIPRISEGS